MRHVLKRSFRDERFKTCLTPPRYLRVSPYRD